ncbi:50S ribosomal protein L25/general stress protein Ctc [Bacillus alkalicellulosilyticus]|uniref:50S ribosomal protein L25/general stress protein Ctc n=1 Tax=Alkalihalobacterium alkalicellulosilyticum TaxID=1912214 RepID=UPI000995E732|nr:50S ribosomal protein L25/general stress protein Ctc [Bacillus alkalicellulosilyticus]
MSTVLKAEARKDLKNSATRKYRLNGQVPAVVYGKKTASQPVAVNGIEFIKTIKEIGRNGIISLGVNDNSHQVIVTEIQSDPLRGDLVHIDFFEVDMKSEIDADVRVSLVGEAPGVNEGGIVSHLLHQVSVRCLPADIPESIEVDISGLNVGDSISIGEIINNYSVAILNEPDETIVTVLHAAAEKEPGQGQEDAEEAEAAEEAQTDNTTEQE